MLFFENFRKKCMVCLEVIYRETWYFGLAISKKVIIVTD